MLETLRYLHVHPAWSILTTLESTTITLPWWPGASDIYGRASELIDPWGIWLQSQISKFQTHFNDKYLKYFLWNCYQVNATTAHWSLVAIHLNRKNYWCEILKKVLKISLLHNGSKNPMSQPAMALCVARSSAAWYWPCFPSSFSTRGLNQYKDAILPV